MHSPHPLQTTVSNSTRGQDRAVRRRARSPGTSLRDTRAPPLRRSPPGWGSRRPAGRGSAPAPGGRGRTACASRPRPSGPAFISTTSQRRGRLVSARNPSTGNGNSEMGRSSPTLRPAARIRSTAVRAMRPVRPNATSTSSASSAWYDSHRCSRSDMTAYLACKARLCASNSGGSMMMLLTTFIFRPPFRPVVAQSFGGSPLSSTRRTSAFSHICAERPVEAQQLPASRYRSARRMHSIVRSAHSCTVAGRQHRHPVPAVPAALHRLPVVLLRAVHRAQPGARRASRSRSRTAARRPAM